MATPYIDYYEHSRDLQFLNDSAYPFLRNVAEFYASFAVKNGSWGSAGSRYDFLNVCAQEQCTQRQNNNRMTINANTLVDIAHATMAFQKALEWSVTLGVDVPLRSRWSNVLAGLAPLPSTLDNGTLTFGPDGAPLPSNPPRPVWSESYTLAGGRCSHHLIYFLIPPAAKAWSTLSFSFFFFPPSFLFLIPH